MGKPFVINRYGRIVFPSNFLADLDFSVLETLEQFAAVIRRDFEEKAPTGADIVERVEAGRLHGRATSCCATSALNLFWVNRYAMTMYDKRPTRWRDVPRQRDDVFLPVLTPWEDAELKVAAVEAGYASLPADLGRRGRGQDLPRPVRRLPPQAAPRDRAARPSSRRWPRSSPSPASLTYSSARLRPGLPGATATTTSSTAPRRCRSWRRCTRRRWCCTTSTRGTAPTTRLDRGRARSTTTTSWWCSTAQPRRARVHPARRRPARRRAPAAGPRRRARQPRSAPYPPVDRARSASRVMPRLEALAVVQGRARLHQRRPHPQRRVLLVADDAPRRSARRPASRRGSTPSATSTTSRCSAAAAALEGAGRRPGGDRRGDLLLLHEHAG